jgi:hypothetical protein
MICKKNFNRRKDDFRSAVGPVLTRAEAGSLVSELAT